MKKNVPSDHLEEFLKNAFEEYTESPSEEVWERIAAETKGVPPAPFRIFRSYPLWISLAVALLAGFIIYQSIQVNQELKQINHSVEKQQVEIEGLQNQKKQERNSPNVQKQLPQAGIDKYNKTDEIINNEVNKSIENEQNEQEQEVAASITSSENIKAKHGTASASLKKANTPLITKNKPNTKNSHNYVEKQVNPNNFITQQSSETIYLNPSIPTVGSPSPEVTPPAVANVNSSNTTLFELNKLATLEQSLKTTRNTSTIHIPKSLQLPIQPLHEKKGFYVGIHAVAMKNWSQISIKTPRPIPPRDRKEFNQPDVEAANSLALGVQVGTKIGKNISLESGILHRTNTATATHQPMFKFKDRKFPPHGGGPRDCQFEYDLNTPTGTVAVAITVENTATAVPDEEDVLLEITAEQSLTYLSVPLLLNYQIGKGKLHLNAKGGVLTNFLLDNDFSITDINSANINFRPQTSQPFQSEPVYFNQVSLDYLLQIGISYDLTRHLSIHLDPTFIGSLSNPSSNRFIQSSNYAAGLNAGLTWSF